MYRYFYVILIILVFVCSIFADVRTEGDSVVFTLADADYSSVAVAGSFNEWSSETHILSLSDGVWSISIPMDSNSFTYKFVIDGGSEWILDPDNEKIVKDGNFTNSFFEHIVTHTVTGDETQDEMQDVVQKQEEISEPKYTEFTYTDTEAESVSVAGDFNKWSIDSHSLSDPDGDGVWKGRFVILPGTYMYMFVVNGTRWYSDPEAQIKKDDRYGGKNSFIEITR